MADDKWWFAVVKVNGQEHHTIQPIDPLLETVGPGISTKRWEPHQIVYRARISQLEQSLGLTTLMQAYSRGIKPGLL